jgi:inosine triphosphate pyrophosphatase
LIYFITGNAGKFREVSAIIPDVEQLKLDLDEIQSLDPTAVIEHKLAQATAHHEGAFMVEDTSLSINCLGGLPGTFIKWFTDSLGLAGLADLAACYEDRSAIARATIGYRDEKGVITYFSGEIHGTIVAPRGGGFGWDAIFVPTGYKKTFGELGIEVKNSISMRGIATRKLADHLKS